MTVPSSLVVMVPGDWHWVGIVGWGVWMERERIDSEFVANAKQKLEMKCARVRHI